MRLIHQRAAALPLTHVNLILPRTGVCLDPPGRQGVTRLLTRLLFMGAGGLGNTEFNSRLERLGATVGSVLTNDYVTLRLVTLSRNLEPALALFLSALREPNLDERELERLRAELLSAWVAEREEVKRLRAQEVYLHAVYQHRPHGYLADGTREGLGGCTLDDVRAQYERLFGGDEPLLAVLSDLERPDVERRVLEAMALPAGRPAESYPWDGFEPPQPSGRRVTVVRDPDTNTDEMLLGAFSTHPGEADWHVHRLISLIFGGDMNSRLFRVVRGERGLSYGASCWYEANQGRGPRNRPAPFTVYTFPSADRSAEAVPLVLQLYEELVERGVGDDELHRARQALTNAHPFMRDTPQKLLALEVDRALYGVTVDDDETNARKLAAVTPDDVLQALRRSHHPDQAHIVLLGDPSRLEPIAGALPNVERVETIGYP